MHLSPLFIIISMERGRADEIKQQRPGPSIKPKADNSPKGPLSLEKQSAGLQKLCLVRITPGS